MQTYIKKKKSSRSHTAALKGGREILNSMCQDKVTTTTIAPTKSIANKGKQTPYN